MKSDRNRPLPCPRFRSALVAIALGVAALTSCAAIEEPNTEPSAAEDACEHAAAGPFEDVSATTGDDEPADVSAEHTAYRVTTADLMDAQQNRGGALSYASAADGDYALFLSQHLDIAVTDLNGAEVALEDSVHEVPECDELTMFHLVELGVGSYQLELGPTSQETFTLVIVPSGEQAHDDEGEG